ncbi:deoxyribodipyrimidine photo-lyase [bacterium]|nr:deoxyribodipyrimidine photo-lyase [bacterium]
MIDKSIIHWFQKDLRLTDNPALYKATTLGRVLPLYILDDSHPGRDKIGDASRVWLHHSLNSLNDSLDQSLAVFQGDPIDILSSLIDRYAITDVCWNIQYEPWCQKRDLKIIKCLENKNIKIHLFNSSLLWNPDSIKKKDGTPYKVFTPFYRRGCMNSSMPENPLPTVKFTRNLIKCKSHQGIESLNLIPSPRWDKMMMNNWSVGEVRAKRLLSTFLKETICHYKTGRDLPAQLYTSRLSPYIHFGELSIRQIWHAAQQLLPDTNTDCFLSQLGWREFSYNLLLHNPGLPFKNLKSKFDLFPWSNNQDHLNAWQRGQTGIPMVDAGMRELWQTGYMHNRLRMIVGSFLVKNLRIDWRKGERWFWDCLVDADLANNSAGWQWIAGCGTDASPYFRIFNPVTQGKKFDPEGQYIRRFVPELKKIPLKYLFSPWEAPKSILDPLGIRLGENYPKPIVDLKQSRLEALEAFSSLKQHVI